MKKPVPFEKSEADARSDKKRGIKEGSKRDERLDAKALKKGKGK